MYLMTHKITRKLHLHWFLYNIVKKSFPFFRYLGRLTRPSTKMYKKAWDSITQEPDYYEKVIKTKLATRPTSLLPVFEDLLNKPVQIKTPALGETWTDKPLEERNHI